MQSTIILILSVILIPGIFVLWQIRENRKIAVKSKSMEHPLPVLRFLNQKLNFKNRYEIVFIAIYKGFRNVFFEFPIELRNAGKKSLEDVTLIFVYPPESPLATRDGFSIESMFPDEVIKRKFLKNSDKQYVTYSIKHVNPNTAVQLLELINLPPTENIFKVPSVTKDKVHVLATIKTTGHFYFEIIFSAKNVQPQSTKFHVQSYEAENLDLISEKIENQFKEKVKKNPYTIIDTKYILIHPKFEIQENKTIKIAIGRVKEDSDIRILEGVPVN